MKYSINILESEKMRIDRSIKNNNLMNKDMRKAMAELSKISELKKAIKILKQKALKS